MRIPFFLLLLCSCREESSLPVPYFEQKHGISLDYSPHLPSVGRLWTGDVDRNGLPDLLYFIRKDSLTGGDEDDGDWHYILSQLVVAYNKGSGGWVTVRTNVYSIQAEDSDRLDIRLADAGEFTCAVILDDFGIRMYQAPLEVLNPFTPLAPSAPMEVDGSSLRNR
ncbi:MAG: hypothetical protein HY520_01475 [Candidatus Aenigmarchaeota archaeon]|nr:hypothetical protein [Candidatus Aenigmarchaeota archaeon]